MKAGGGAFRISFSNILPKAGLVNAARTKGRNSRIKINFNNRLTLGFFTGRLFQTLLQAPLYHIPVIFLISLSLLSASIGVSELMSSPLIWSRICTSTGSSSWNIDNCMFCGAPASAASFTKGDGFLPRFLRLRLGTISLLP